MEIYMDNSATTKVRKEVLDAMMPYFQEEYGNPSSFHSKGLCVKDALDQARETVKNLINAQSPKEIIFTAGGTESINLAIQGLAKAMKGKKNHIITSPIEHHAVSETCKFLQKEGFDISHVNVKKNGEIDMHHLKELITDQTFLITIMYANNEIGTIQDIKAIANIAHEKNIIFHTDACQAGGALNLDVKELGMDMMSLNGSKIYGPKGTGILYKKKDVNIKPLIYGGGQEFNLRSGTENIPGIIGFTKALELAQQDREKEHKRLTQLRDYMIKELTKKIPESILIGDAQHRLPNNVNISFLNVEGEAITLLLNEHEIYASTGSACTSTTLDPSHVITAIGYPYEIAHGTIRFTLGKETTKEHIDKVIQVLPPIVEHLRTMSPVKLTLKDVQ